MDIFDLLKTYNQECSHSEKIQESSYVEAPLEKTHEISDTQNAVATGNDAESPAHTSWGTSPTETAPSRSLVQCILSQYDPLYQTIPVSERKMYLKQRIMDIGSQIEEIPHEFYEPFKFDPKTMKPKLIQLSLQMSLEGKNTRAALMYLNELYLRNFTIIADNRYYPSCPKGYPVETIVYNKNSYQIQGINISSYEKGHPDNSPLINDLGNKNIYLSPLMPISKYKSDELKVLCEKEGIPLKTDKGKMKVKQVLYDELLLHLM